MDGEGGEREAYVGWGGRAALGTFRMLPANALFCLSLHLPEFPRLLFFFRSLFSFLGSGVSLRGYCLLSFLMAACCLLSSQRWAYRKLAGPSLFFRSFPSTSVESSSSPMLLWGLLRPLIFSFCFGIGSEQWSKERLFSRKYDTLLSWQMGEEAFSWYGCERPVVWRLVTVTLALCCWCQTRVGIDRGRAQVWSSE